MILTLFSVFSTQAPFPKPSPTLTPASKTLNNLPSLETSPVTNLPDIYKEGSLEENYQRIINKKQLSPEELNAKQRLIAPLEGGSGTIATTTDFMVEYLKTPQYFMVQILSNDIESAKKKAQKWFNDQGISNQGVCNLPVIFYFSESVSNYLISNNLQFNPTPEGCK